MKLSLVVKVCAAILLITILFLPAVSSQAPAETTTDGGPNFIVTGEMTVESKTWMVGANITVSSGAKLILKDASLIFFPNETKPYFHFTVEKGGELFVENSLITASDAYLSFLMWCYGKVTILNSTITNLASDTFNFFQRGGIIVMNNETVLKDNNFYFGNIGVTLVNCEKVVLKNNVFNDTYYAIYVDQSTAEISHNTIRDSVYGIYDVGSEATYSDFDISNSFEGIFSYASSSSFIGNVLDGNNIGAVFNNPMGASLNENSFTDNNKAVQVSMGDIEIKNNYITGGLDGIKLEFVEAEITSNSINGQQAVVSNLVDCTGCTKPQLEGYGACIQLLRSDAKINDNQLNGSNIGIYSLYSSPVIEGNRIFDMTDPIDCNTSCRVDPNIITFEVLSLVTGVGILMVQTNQTTPRVISNTIYENQNDGVFLLESPVIFEDNKITNNLGYGIHTLNGDVSSSNGDLLTGNMDAFAYSIEVSFRTFDPYGDIVSYSEATITNPSSGTSYTQPDLGIGHFTAFLVSFTGAQPTASSEAVEFHSYNMSFTSGSAEFTEVILATPLLETEQNVTIPLYRPDLEVKVLDLKDAAKDKNSKIEVEVYNSGQAAATDVTVYFIWTYKGESRVIGTDVIGEIPVGGTATATNYWKPEETGEQSIIVDVDPDNQIREVDEKNNQVQDQVNVEEKNDLTPYMVIIAIIILIVIVFVIILVYVIIRRKASIEAEQEEASAGRRGRGSSNTGRGRTENRPSRNNRNDTRR